MDFNQYLNVLKTNDQYNITNDVKLLFDDLDYDFNSPFVSINASFLSDLEFLEKEKITIVYPKDRYFYPALIFAKILRDVQSNGSVLSTPINFLPGDKLVINNAVCEFLYYQNVGDETYIWINYGNGKQTQKIGYPVKKFYFEKTTKEAKLSSQSTYLKAMNEYKSTDSNSLSGLIKKHKLCGLRPIIIVGPTRKMYSIFANAQIDNERLGKMLNLYRFDPQKTIKANSPSGNPNLIFCSSLEEASIIVEKEDLDIGSVFVDCEYISSLDDCLEDLDDIIGSNCKIIVLSPENLSIDFSPILVRDFSIFQWKKEYLVNIDEENDLQLASFKKLNISLESFRDEFIEKAYKEFLAFKNDVDNFPSVIAIAYWRFFKLITNKLAKLCYYRDTSDKNLNHYFEELEIYEKTKTQFDSYSLSEIKNHQLAILIRKEFDSFVDILTGNVKQLEKADRVIDLLRTHNQESYAIIVPDDFYLDICKFSIISNAGETVSESLIDVITVSDYVNSKKHFANSIVTGWYPKELMKTILFSNNADNIYVLLYGFEIPWAISSVSEWRKQYIVNDFSKINPEIITADEIQFYNFVFPEKSDVVETIEDIQNIQSKTLVNWQKKQTLSSNKERIVEAAPVFFSDSSFAFYHKGKSFINITNIMYDSDDLPVFELTENLKCGDILVLRENSTDIVRQLADDMLLKSHQENARIVSKSWQESITTYAAFNNCSSQDMIDKILRAGCKRNQSTIKYWIENENMICPKSLDDLRFIAIALEDDLLLDSVDNIYKAAETVKSAHIKAGRSLTDKLLSCPEIQNAIRTYRDNGFCSFTKISLRIDSVGDVVILKVVDVGDFFECPTSFCNHRENNY